VKSDQRFLYKWAFAVAFFSIGLVLSVQESSAARIWLERSPRRVRRIARGRLGAEQWMI